MHSILKHSEDEFFREGECANILYVPMQHYVTLILSSYLNLETSLDFSDLLLPFYEMEIEHVPCLIIENTICKTCKST